MVLKETILGGGCCCSNFCSFFCVIFDFESLTKTLMDKFQLKSV